MFVLLFEIMILLSSNMAYKLEPSCSSFHYEEQTLEKMIRLQIFVEKMKEEVDSSQHKVREELNDLSTEREKIQSEIEAMKDLLVAAKSDLEDYFATMKVQHMDDIEQFGDEMLKIKESTMLPPVAFQSYKVEDKTMSDRKIVIFISSMINYGDSYNNQTGVFTAPLDGIYIFSAQIFLQGGGSSYFGFYVNERFVQHGLMADKYYSSVYTLVAVADVAKGAGVTVRCRASCTGSSLAGNTHSTSSFCGVLIHGK